MRVAHSTRITDAVEELEDLDRPLAPDTGRVAVARRSRSAVGALEHRDDLRQLANAATVVEQVAHDLTDAALPDLLTQHLAHALLRFAERRGQIPDPRRVEASGGD